MTGETLNHFIQRIRLEKAALQLAGNPEKSITEIALDCGFSGSAAFARAFREAFGQSASDWRKNRKMPGNDRKQHGNDWKVSFTSSMYFSNDTHHITWRLTMNSKAVDVNVMDFEPMTVAYVRHVGPYKGDVELFGRLFEKLMTWAAPRGLLSNPDVKTLIVYHDDPDVTHEDKLRTSVCLTVPAETEVSSDIGKMEIPGGAYAVGHFEILPDEYQDAWDSMCGGWLPGSGYQPDDRLSFEQCLNNPEEHPEGRHIVNICIPVKPL